MKTVRDNCAAEAFRKQMYGGSIMQVITRLDRTQFIENRTHDGRRARKGLIALAAVLAGMSGIALMTQSAAAGKADVVAAKAVPTANGTWRFDVTIRHEDTGWEHYADRYEILSMKGRLLATRVLAHPHETEQPFTRSLYNVRIPRGVKRVRIRAHDSRHGYGGGEIVLTLPSHR